MPDDSNLKNLRIFAIDDEQTNLRRIADVFDALAHEPPYKAGFSRAGSG